MKLRYWLLLSVFISAIPMPCNAMWSSITSWFHHTFSSPVETVEKVEHKVVEEVAKTTEPAEPLHRIDAESARLFELAGARNKALDEHGVKRLRQAINAVRKRIEGLQNQVAELTGSYPKTFDEDAEQEVGG